MTPYPILVKVKPEQRTTARLILGDLSTDGAVEPAESPYDFRVSGSDKVLPELLNLPGLLRVRLLPDPR